MNAYRVTAGTLATIALAASLTLLCPTAGAVDALSLGPSPLTEGSNPYTGRVSAIACSRVNPNLYFAAGADGGVWRTTDAGATWAPLTDLLPTSSIGALAIDPTNDNVLYAGSGEANFANHSRYGLGLYKSEDGGSTWTVLGEDAFAGRCFSRILIDPRNPQVLLAGITRAGGFPEMAAAKGHPGATGPVGVFRSTDGGVTWEQLPGLPDLAATDLAFQPGNPDVIYAGIGHIFGHADNGLYQSLDGGGNWTKLTGGGLPSETWGRISVFTAPSQPQRLYVLITKPATASGDAAEVLGAYRSDDGGQSWTALPLPNIQATYGWYLSVITVQPTNADVVFMGGVELYRSQNAGASWDNVTPAHVDLHALEWDAAGNLLAGNDGGVHRSTNLGNSWGARNSRLGVVQFYAGFCTHPTNDNIVIGGTQDNGSALRLPTRQWIQVYGGDGGWTQLDQSSVNRVFVEFQGTGNLYVSTTGGGSGSFQWTGYGINTEDRNCFHPPYLIDPTDSSRMWYATQRVYLSTDGGGFWNAISDDLTNGGNASVRSLVCAASDPNVLYAATNDGRVLRSADGGASFSLIATDVPGWPRVTREICVPTPDPNTVYLAVAYFGETHVRRTVDGGQTWESLDGDLPDIPVNVVGVDARGRWPVIYAGADDGLYRSINDGRSWHRYGQGLPRTAVIDLRVEPARQRLMLTTQGRGAWRIPIGLPGDCNCDGEVNLADINLFVAAIPSNEAAWRARYAEEHGGAQPTCDFVVCDLNGDNRVGFGDIDPFVELLSR